MGSAVLRVWTHAIRTFAASDAFQRARRRRNEAHRAGVAVRLASQLLGGACNSKQRKQRLRDASARIGSIGR